MNRFVKGLLGLIYPLRAVCMGCGTAIGFDEDWLCPECRRELAKNWVGAAPPPKSIDGAAYVSAYVGTAAGIVQRMKYTGVHRLAGFMGEDMTRAFRLLDPADVDLVTFVPMHPKRRRERGYNHAELLAREVAGRLELPCEMALIRVRNTPQQAKLHDRDRRRNLKDAFEPHGALEGRSIVLVDDVCTTGSTARACAGALRRGGAARVYLLCYAVALPKRGRN